MIPPRDVPLPEPPAAAPVERRRSLIRALLMTTLPALLPMLGLVAVMSAVGQAGTFVIMTAALAGSMALATTFSTLMQHRDESDRHRRGLEESGRRELDFTAQLERARERCARLYREDAESMADRYPAPGGLAVIAARRSSRLWERRPDDPDFLDLRLGTGPRPSALRFEERSAATSDPRIAALVTDFQAHATAPISLAVGPGAQLGVCGSGEGVTALVASLVAQLAVLHRPSDVSLVVVSRDERLCAAAKWLPHALIGSRPAIARGSRELAAVGASLGGEASSSRSPRRIVIVADAREWELLPGRLASALPAPVAEIAAVLFLAGERAALPAWCHDVVEVGPGGARLTTRVSDRAPVAFAADEMSETDLEAVCLALADLVDERLFEERGLPDDVTLAQLYATGVDELSEVVERRWAAARRGFRLRAPVGIGEGGEYVEIDLRRDGPHALVAGTTGSGKSELLRSLVLSLAASVPPDLLNFLLIDYKGASTFGELAGIPHVVGTVSDLDVAGARRAIRSLRAELKRRERLLASVDPPVTNIGEYQLFPRAEPLANLVIIIDEFHRLVTEIPDFISEMVTLAQQGRSLGIHLVLSTQRPSGVVSDQIRANTNLRVCLRVTDEADSRDVIGTPDAAYIRRAQAGRTYIRVGTEQLTVMQCARASGRVNGREEDIAVRPFLAPRRAQAALYRDAVARRVVPDAPIAVARPTGGSDQLSLLIGALREAASRSGLPPARPPWHPPLPDALPLTDLEIGTLQALPIGLGDEPDLQRQEPLRIDLARGAVLVAGGSGTGKTATLLAIVAAAAGCADPTSLHIYALDFGGGGLRPLAALPHCGGVADQEDAPSVRWVLQSLRDLVADRLAAAPDDRARLPWVLVVVDDFPALWAATASDVEDPAAGEELLRVIDAGRAVRVAFAISAERPSAVRSHVLGVCATRIAHHMVDREEYAALSIQMPSVRGEPIPGRGLVSGSGKECEAQIAVADLARLALGAEVPPRDGGPLPVSPLPSSLDYRQLRNEERAAVRLGLREGRHPDLIVDRDRPLVILGPPGSGRSNALAVALLEHARLGVERVFAVNPRQSPALRAVARSLTGARYAERGGDLAAIWEEVGEEVRLRRARVSAGEWPGVPLVLALDDADAVEIPMAAEEAIEGTIIEGRDLAVRLMLTLDTRRLRAGYPTGWRRAALLDGTGLLLAPQTRDDFDLLGIRGRPSNQPPGRGYACASGEKTEVQIALLDAEGIEGEGS